MHSRFLRLLECEIELFVLDGFLLVIDSNDRLEASDSTPLLSTGSDHTHAVFFMKRQDLVHSWVSTRGPLSRSAASFSSGTSPSTIGRPPACNGQVLK